MKEEKQLDEMKHIACIGCRHLMECDESIQESCGFMVLIEALYNEGYRKQSDGEWVKQERKKGVVSPEAVCSNCGREVVYQVKDDRWEFEEYCPHCGAKMKGGAE